MNERNCSCEDGGSDLCGWLHTTEDKVERCDTCKRFANDDEAIAAHDATNCDCTRNQ